MKGQSPKITSKALRKFTVLGQKQGTIRLSDLARDLGLGVDETLIFLREVFPSGKGAEIYHQNNECWVDVDATALQYVFSLTPGEWIQLQLIFSSIPATTVLDQTIMTSLKQKLSNNGPIKVVMELLNQLELWDQNYTVKQQAMIHLLDQAVLEKQLVQVTTEENKSYLIYPCKVVHIEGRLSVIAEDSHDRCLAVIGLSGISSVVKVESYSSSHVTSFEVDEFIAAIRSMNEKETRLILKIHDHQSVNLFPNHHFLGKPCMITNPEGDLIWAAYVEPCEALYEWLTTLGKNVEILDPMAFKQDYLAYCEEKLGKVA
jgi:predicted DNA-binding transcriptional regulator YafY